MTTFDIRGLKARGHTRQFEDEDLKVLLEHIKYSMVVYSIYAREERVRNRSNQPEYLIANQCTNSCWGVFTHRKLSLFKADYNLGWVHCTV